MVGEDGETVIIDENCSVCHFAWEACNVLSNV